MTRCSTDTPTLAPQPPQRIDAWARASSASEPEARATADGGGTFILLIGGGRPVVYACIHVRSIQSLSVHSHPPSLAFDSRAIKPREATHVSMSPPPMSPRKVDCGMKGASASPRSECLRLFVSGVPWRTAKTPAFGRGCSSTAATSPAAKTPGVLTDSSVGWTAMKPLGSRARLVS